MALVHRHRGAAAARPRGRRSSEGRAGRRRRRTDLLRALCTARGRPSLDESTVRFGRFAGGPAASLSDFYGPREATDREALQSVLKYVRKNPKRGKVYRALPKAPLEPPPLYRALRRDKRPKRPNYRATAPRAAPELYAAAPHASQNPVDLTSLARHRPPRRTEIYLRRRRDASDGETPRS